MKITIIQQDIAWKDVEANIANLENLVANAREVGAYLIEELQKLPQLKEVRGRGLMIGFEIEGSASEMRLRLLKEHHIFTGGAGVSTVRLLPALTITRNEADKFLAALKKILNE